MKISIVIPTYNVEKEIERCIESILNSSKKHNFEIIVVDDGSSDRTREIVEKLPVRLIVSKENKGAAHARNLGVKNAKGKIIVFVDADCVVRPEWLEKLVPNLKDDVVAVTGAYKTLNINSDLAKFIGYDMDFRHERLPYISKVFGTYNSAVYKKVLEAIGGFDEKIKGAAWEDADFGLRLSERYKIAFDKNVRVYHSHLTKIKSYFKKQMTQAKGQVIFARKGKKTDNYVGLSTKLQIPVTGLFFVFLFLGLFSSCLFLGSLISFVFLALLNFNFLAFMFKKESVIFLVKSLFFILVRNTSWIFGIFLGYTCRK